MDAFICHCVISVSLTVVMVYQNYIKTILSYQLPTLSNLIVYGLSNNIVLKLVISTSSVYHHPRRPSKSLCHASAEQ